MGEAVQGSLGMLCFLARNPCLSGLVLKVNLHVDLEPQKDYRPGYPIEKRGIYYLSRLLNAQLDLLTEQTDYGQLEKCYSIFICRDNIPLDEQMSISFYGIQNTKNIGSCIPKRENYDLLQLVIIRLGDKEYQSEGQDLLEFLSAIFYPHAPGFRQRIAKYVDVESCLQEEVPDHMFSLSECIYQDGREEGIEQGIEQGREQGRAEGIEAFVLDNLEEHVPEKRIIEKMQRRFHLEEKEARAYFERYAIVEM